MSMMNTRKKIVHRLRIIPIMVLLLFSLGLGMAWASEPSHDHEPAHEAEAATEHTDIHAATSHVASHDDKEAALLTPAVSARAWFPLLAILVPVLAALGVLLSR